MPLPTVTFADRIGAIVGAAVFAVIVFGVATLFQRLISESSHRKRVQGRPIRWWVTGLYFVGAVIGALIADNKQYYLGEVVGGIGGFGILAGLLIGNLHGGVCLFLDSRKRDLSEGNRESSE